MTIDGQESTACAVLIVEDDSDLCALISQIITLEGFQVATAANGREALDYLHHNSRPDVILLDLMMPVMDGYEFLRRQRTDLALSLVPVIVLSALHQTNTPEVSATAFMQKPLEFDRLLDLVRTYSHKPAGAEPR